MKRGHHQSMPLYIGTPKLLPKLADKYTTEERLTVAVGTQDEIKLLGVPCYEPRTDQHMGDIITQKTAELLAQLLQTLGM